MSEEVPDTKCLTDTDQRRRAVARILRKIKGQNSEEPPIPLTDYDVEAGKNVSLEFGE